MTARNNCAENTDKEPWEKIGKNIIGSEWEE